MCRDSSFVEQKISTSIFELQQLHFPKRDIYMQVIETITKRNSDRNRFINIQTYQLLKTSGVVVKIVLSKWQKGVRCLGAWCGQPHVL